MAYNPQKDAVVISKPFGAIGFPIDGRSFFYDEANFVRRAFISTVEVLAYFDTPFKREGMFYVFVNSTGTLQPDGTILGGTRVAYWWKEGTADNQLIVVVEKGDKGESYTINASGTTAGRAAYDTQSVGFSYLDISLSIVYFKLSAVSGNWSTGTSFGRGEDGADGANGTGITSIAFYSTTSDNGLASQPGGIDTYRITLSNSNTYDISLTNGNDLNING